MRLKQFSVQGLFGLFEHKIPFNLNERITIIHAPNGYGKTVMLRLIEAFFGNSFKIFREMEFKTIIFEFDDGRSVRIVKKNRPPQSGQPPRPSILVFSLIKSGKIIENWDTDIDKKSDGRPGASPTYYLDRYVPYLTRVGVREYRDVRSGEQLSLFEAVERYSDHLPVEARKGLSIPDWLSVIRRSVHCQLIETQRLMKLARTDDTRWPDPATAFIPAVKTDSEGLVSRMRQTLADNANLSSSLDRTFPTRALSRLGETKNAPSEDTLRAKLYSLERQRARLSEVGLLDKADGTPLVPREHMEMAARKFLSEYVLDTEKKLSTYDDILKRIELLIEIVNSRFQFKSLSISRAKGFVFTDVLGKKVELESLSSGEQHELVLVYGLLFNTKEGTLLLIDEPEISLHVAWQRQFLSDLRRIIELSPLDALLSTHSPQLIGGHLNLAVKLEGPKF